MKPHVKIWIKGMGYTPGDYMPCQFCGVPAVDIHHLESRGHGGRTSMDRFDNLIGLCRYHHTRAHQDREFNEILKELVAKRNPHAPTP